MKILKIITILLFITLISNPSTYAQLGTGSPNTAPKPKSGVPSGPGEIPMGPQNTGIMSTARYGLKAITDLFKGDSKYCAEPASSKTCNLNEDMFRLISVDAPKLIEDLKMSEIEKVLGKTYDDYGALLGLPKDKKNLVSALTSGGADFSLGPREFIQSSFKDLSKDEQVKTKAFYDRINARAQNFKTNFDGKNQTFKEINIQSAKDDEAMKIKREQMMKSGQMGQSGSSGFHDMDTDQIIKSIKENKSITEAEKEKRIANFQDQTKLMTMEKHLHPVNSFPGAKAENVLDENGKPLHNGWFWEEALKESGNDPVKAMSLLSFCGQDTNYGSASKMHNGDFLNCSEYGNWAHMPSILPDGAQLPPALEKEIVDVHQASPLPSANLQNKVLGTGTAKNYHTMESALIACQLAHKGYPKDEIVNISRDLGIIYRDLSYRHLTCPLREGSAGSKEQMMSKTSESSMQVYQDALTLMDTLNRDDKSNADTKLAKVSKPKGWDDKRYAQARIVTKQMLLDWDWTAAQHEDGAKWAVSVCSPKK